MEIIFNKLSYKNSSNNKKILDNINLIIKPGSIVSLMGDNLEVIPSLLNVIKRPSSGEIKIDNIVIKRTSHINNVNVLRKKIGYVSDSVLFIKDNVKDEIKNVLSNFGYKTSNVIKHIVDSLKMVGLGEEYLERRIDTLSSSEKKKVQLALVLSYNPELIILDGFFQGLYYRDRDYFKKLFVKLKTKYKKTIIVLTKDLKDTFDAVDKIYVINNGNLVISGGIELYYGNKLYKYVDIPKIIEFTKYAHDKGHTILEYTDLKELIKEIYRNVR